MARAAQGQWRHAPAPAALGGRRRLPQRAAKNICYTVSRSNAMLNIDEGGGVEAGIPVYKIVCWCVVAVLAIGLVIADVFVVVLPLVKTKKANREV